MKTCKTCSFAKTPPQYVGDTGAFINILGCYYHPPQTFQYRDGTESSYDIVEYVTVQHRPVACHAHHIEEEFLK